jgi:ankyrin repeat protein
MFKSVFDTLPVEIVLLVVDNLGPKDLLSLLRCLRWLPSLLTSKQIMTKDKEEWTILHLLAENGDADLIDTLLEKDNVDPDPRSNWNDQTPISCAAKNGHMEIVKLLIGKYNVNPNFNRYYWTPLLWQVVASGHLEIVKMLIIIQCNTDPLWATEGLALLWYTVWEGNKEVVEMILATDSVDINRVTRFRDFDCGLADGTTPLILAAACGYKKIVEMLLAKDGIDINHVDQSGRAALSYAAACGFTEIVEILVAMDGIDLDPVDRVDWTP